MLVLENTQIAMPTFVSSSVAASPSKNPCMVRIHGQSRYRNDPYNYLVLPPLASHTPAAAAAASSVNNATRDPMPKAAMSWPLRKTLDVLSTTAPTGRHAARVKAEVQRASNEYAEASPSSSASEEEPSQPLYALVHFKHESCVYQCSLRLPAGTLVVVEGDRGVNMGEVASITTEKPNHPVPSRVVRVATDEDRQQLRIAREREVGARELAKHLVSQFRMDISIVDTEFQSDGNKLTVYFAAPRPVDFRRLQRALFRQYHCRIWLVNWNELPRRM